MARQSGRDAYLAAGEGWTLHVSRWRDRSAKVTVTASSDELAKEVLERATRGAVKPDAPEDAAVTVGFWRHGKHAAVRKARPVAVEPWPAIRRNYGARVAEALDRLMALEPSGLSGRLLLHGPPGTGKTSALRALAHAWRRWCDVECVLDPEVLFNDPGYLLEVSLGRGGPAARQP